MKIIWEIVYWLIPLAITILSTLVSEELRSRLDRLPNAVLRLAIRRLPAELRSSIGDEWKAELHHILRQAEGRPLTRLILAMRYTLGLLRTARRIGRELRAVRTGAAPIPRKPASGFPALRRAALVGTITASLVGAMITITARTSITAANCLLIGVRSPALRLTGQHADLLPGDGASGIEEITIASSSSASSNSQAAPVVPVVPDPALVVPEPALAPAITQEPGSSKPKAC
ncbi:MAG TPA: hypothetical protein VFO16_21820 [Pseudonocardiaceae bacterium]|nr:hypothetical protein [Pseudonocardiaceae bacterium]